MSGCGSSGCSERPYCAYCRAAATEYGSNGSKAGFDEVSEVEILGAAVRSCSRADCGRRILSPGRASVTLEAGPTLKVEDHFISGASAILRVRKDAIRAVGMCKKGI